MTIEKLRVLVDTTFGGCPKELIESLLRDAVDEYDTLRDLFGKLAYSKIIVDEYLLADPEIYNKIVEIFNKSAK